MFNSSAAALAAILARILAEPQARTHGDLRARMILIEDSATAFARTLGALARDACTPLNSLDTSRVETALAELEGNCRDGVQDLTGPMAQAVERHDLENLRGSYGSGLRLRYADVA